MTSQPLPSLIPACRRGRLIRLALELVAGAKAGPDAMPIRFVQICSVSSSDITLPSAVLRSSVIELMGSGIASIPLDRFVDAISGLLQAATPAGFQIEATPVPPSDFRTGGPITIAPGAQCSPGICRNLEFVT